jgi:hypothetical protein
LNHWTPTSACSNTEQDIFVILYVDDLLIAAPTVDLIFQTRDALRAVYTLKELGEVKRFLGFDIRRDRDARKVFISQETYIRALLAKRGMEDCNPASTPWPSKFELPAVWDALPEHQKQFIKDTGSVNWASCGTRPDISYTVSRLAEANAGPSQAHLHLMHHLLRYLKGTAAFGIELGGRDITVDDLRMMTFADASLADRLPSRHSTGGHAVFLAGAPVLWKTKKQSYVALSTTEAEFTNLTPAALSAKWVAQILSECDAPQPAPLILFTDSLNAYQTAMHPLNKARTRAIDLRYKWVIEQTQRGLVRVEHIRGVDMPADGLTKPLAREKHTTFVRLLGMVEKRVPWANREARH